MVAFVSVQTFRWVKKTWLLLLLWFIFILFFYRSILVYQLPVLREGQERRIIELEQEIALVEAENEVLLKKLQAMERPGSVLVESEARYYHGLVRPGENFYLLVDAVSGDD